jgi:hypothetical protein
MGCMEANDNATFWLPNSGGTAGSTAAKGLTCEAMRLACAQLVRCCCYWKPVSAATPALCMCSTSLHMHALFKMPGVLLESVSRRALIQCME